MAAGGDRRGVGLHGRAGGGALPGGPRRGRGVPCSAERGPDVVKGGAGAGGRADAAAAACCSILMESRLDGV